MKIDLKPTHNFGYRHDFFGTVEYFHQYDGDTKLTPRDGFMRINGKVSITLYDCGYMIICGHRPFHVSAKQFHNRIKFGAQAKLRAAIKRGDIIL